MADDGKWNHPLKKLTSGGHSMAAHGIEARGRAGHVDARGSKMRMVHAAAVQKTGR
jgi:hypothetical protein